MTTSAQNQAVATRRANNRARGAARPYPRVRARPIIPGRRTKITRRCVDGRMFLAPGDNPSQLANFIGYCLALAASEYGIQVHACVVMSNHHHTDVTDPKGVLPAFVQRFHSLIARGLNALHGRGGAFWDSQKPCNTTRPSEDQAFGDLVYTILNPVKSGLVESSHQWPGFTTRGWRFGHARTFTRPPWFFDRQGKLPDTASLTLVRPAILPDLDDNAFFDELERELQRRELQLRDERHRDDKEEVLGVDKIAQQHWSGTPKSEQERFKIAPKVAASSNKLRLTELLRIRAWEREYAAARDLLRAGLPAVFPFGTYWLKHFAGVQVAEQAPQ